MSTASRTTSAPNRPPRSSGSEAVGAAAVAPAGACANCGAPLGGAYCAACGQHAAPPDPTFRDLAGEAWDAFVSVDGKLVTSVRLLLTRPGEITARYLAGHRVRFIPPLRLYLTCSVAFFLVEAALPHDASIVRVNTSDPAAVRDPRQIEREVAAMHAPAWRQRFKRGALRSVTANPDAFRARLFERAPQAIFVLVPLQAALLALVYRRRRRNFPSHLVFALHSHAALFTQLALASVLAAVLPHALKPLAGLALFATVAVYLPRATRRVYGGRWGATLARLTVVGAGYLVGFLAALVALITAAFWTLGAPAGP